MAQFFKRLRLKLKSESENYVIDGSTEISNILRSISETNRSKLNVNVRKTLANNLDKTQYELNMSIAKELSDDVKKYYIDCLKKNKHPDFLNYFLTISNVQNSIKQKFNEYYISASNIITLKNIPDIPDIPDNIVKTKEFKGLILDLRLFLEYFRDLYDSNINKNFMVDHEVYYKLEVFINKYTNKNQKGGRNHLVNSTNTYKYKIMNFVAQFVVLEYRLATSKSLFILAIILAPLLLICVFFNGLLFGSL